MAIIPDAKDWTWVLERPCPECGFDAASVAGPAVADGIRANAGAWRALLDHPASARRPSADRWSAHEYACHVRDVFQIGAYRIGLMLHEDDPTFPNWDQDQTAAEDGYQEQEPAIVLGELEAAGEALAALLDSVAPAAWARPGLRSDGARFTVETFARYVLHDPVHHVWDVEEGYAALA